MRFIYTKQFSYFIALLAICGMLIFVHARGWFGVVNSVFAEAPRPIAYVISGTGNSIKSFFQFFPSVVRLNNNNAVLKEQVLTLEQQNVALNEYKFENEILKKELNYRQTASIQLISAIVIAQDPTGFSQTITINAGAQDGIRTGRAVLAQGVYIGKIISADKYTSKALLITDPQSTVDAQISSTQDNGILRGSYGSGLVLDMISQKAQINRNEQIVTAGLTDQIPKGLLIGTIGELQSQKNDLLQKASVVSAVDLKNLHFVSVIR